MGEERRDRLVVRKLVPASCEEVFDAWLDPDSLRDWMCPGDILRADATVDARVGGTYRITMRSATHAFEHTGEYRVVDRPSKLVFTWVSNSTGNLPTLVTVEFFDRGGSCEVVLTHERFADAEQVKRHVGGWRGILDKLAAHVDRPK